MTSNQALVELKKELLSLQQEIIAARHKILSRLTKTVKIEKIHLKKLLYKRSKIIKQIKLLTVN